jgi:large subunit ribosomal protein L7/L12
MYDPGKEYDKIVEARHLARALVLAIRGRFGTGAEDKANALEALALECMHRVDDLEVARLVLVASGERKIEVIKEVRAFTGLDLKGAKELVEAAPITLSERFGVVDTDAFKRALEGAGAAVLLV